MFRPDGIYRSPREIETRRYGDVTVLLHPDGPNWVATGEEGVRILHLFDGRRNFNDVVQAYAAATGFECAKAWQHVETMARDALRQKFLAEVGGGEPGPEPGADSPPEPLEEIGAGGGRPDAATLPVRGATASTEADDPYPGRAPFLANQPLTDLWIHTNNSCNLACAHCLVSSGPDGDGGLPSKALLDVIDQARALGTVHFFLTGGEPFLRRDLFELLDRILEDPAAEAVVLTNGILLPGRILEEITARDTRRIRLQISLDGPAAEINDPIRGAGSFDRIVRGIRAAVEAGVETAVSTVITAANAAHVPAVTRLVGELGGRTHHLLWLHKRGRAVAEGHDDTPPVEAVIDTVRGAREAGRGAGVTVDNLEAVKARLTSGAGTKWDLSKAGVGSLCVYADGTVYPSASMANVPELRCGDIREETLESILRSGEVPAAFRRATLAEKEICRECPLRFLCGGGDIEHAYFYGGSIRAHDPYCDLHKAMIADAFRELAGDRRALVSNGRSGYNAPVLFTGMSDGTICPATDDALAPVRTTSSECVLAFELDHGRAVVREFYGEAAEHPQEDLCCPVQPAAEDLSHIPKEVVERFYGCGSPIGLGDVRPGETTLDLGSGAGIDVFIAAKKVGPAGRAIGVDMTDRMLEEAHRARPIVAETLGYDVVDFREGFLEEIPVEDRTVDLVTSNCVINLSPDKRRVFNEMWRVLKDHGRMVVADIVAEEEVPPEYRQDPRLWGECISGALTEEQFMAYLERAGFYGVQVLRKSFWREVEGYRFHSVTVRGWKFEKRAGCVFRGQAAIYRGPFKGVSDEEGHWFPRGVPVEVCSDTAAKLSRPPYEGMFLITDPTKDVQDAYACCGDPGAGGGSCCGDATSVGDARDGSGTADDSKGCCG